MNVNKSLHLLSVTQFAVPNQMSSGGVTSGVPLQVKIKLPYRNQLAMAALLDVKYRKFDGT